MNAFDDLQIAEEGFSYRDALGQDRWELFQVSTFVSTVGTLSTQGRYRIIGRECEFQAQLSATSSIATTTGTHFVSLPIAAKGLSGMASVTNTSTKSASSAGIDVATSRCYLPSLTSTSAIISLAGWYEIG